jgi:hypothetical protein
MEPGIEIGSHLTVGDLAHATAQGIADQGSLINDGLTLEILVAGICNRFPDPLLRVHFLGLTPRAFARHANHSIRLVAVFGGEPAMRGHDFTERVNLFAVAGRMGGDLSGLLPIAAGTL